MLSGREILSCPRREVPVRFRVWIEAYASGAAEAPYTERRRMSPILVQAVTALERERRAIDVAELRLRDEQHREEMERLRAQRGQGG